METRANYLLIGAFTVLSLIMAAIFTVWIANAGLDKSYTLYDVKFRGPVRGVEIGGEVKFNGINVGEVTHLSLDSENPSLVVARIRVLSDTPVKEDSIAQLEPSGLTGMNYIQILAGGPKSPPLKRLKDQPRAVIKTQGGQIDKLFAGGQGVLDTSMETLNRIKILLDDQNLANIAATLENTRRATDLITREGQLFDNANNAAKTIKDAGDEVKKLAIMVGDIGKTSSESFNSTAQTYNELGKGLIEETKSISGKTNTILASSDLLVKDLHKLTNNTNNSVIKAQSTLKDLDETNKSINEASKSIKIAADDVSVAARSVDSFFASGSTETLPIVNDAAMKIQGASQSLDQLLKEANKSPTGLLSKPANSKVKWKK